MENKQRDKFVQEIFKKEPDMKVLYINQKTNGNWKQEKIISELTFDEKKQFNLRKQFKDEIILDVEEPYRKDEIIEKLNNKKYSYTIWETGSRGLHISLIFSGLETYELKVRNQIRYYIISEFETDLKLAKESQWLALEWTPHFKTGIEKKMLDVTNNGKNIIDKEIVDFCITQIESNERRIQENKEIIKDYHINDPYLKFVLENQIESGDRNNVLFKNLAIGLVKSGIDIEQIRKYAAQIVENCPGKNVGEFMGWVHKAKSGELDEYNKTELVQWSLNYNYPVLYKLYSDEELIDFMSIKQLWDEIWKNKIACQDVWRDLLFYNVIGTILDEKEEDYRCHVIFSSYSSTGKDEGLNLARDILDRLQYKTRAPSTVTDKTLIGGINTTAIEYNTKYGLLEDNIENKGKVWKDPIEKGFLANTDWMCFGEAEFILKPGAHNRHIQLILRQAMDKSRKVEKGVAGWEIPLKTNTSFVLVTYTMNKVVNSILHNGLFQRALFYNRPLKDGEHKKIRKFINKKKFNTEENNKFNEKKYIAKLLEKLKTMKMWYKSNRQKFEYEDGSEDLVNNLWEKTEREYKTFFNADKEILDSIIRRSSGNLHKLCTLTAVVHMQNTITKSTIRYCFDLAVKCVDSVKTMIALQDKSKKSMYSLLQMVDEGNCSKMILQNELEKTFKMKSPNSRVKFVNGLIEAGYCTTYQLGRKNMLSLTEKGRNYLLYEE